MTVLTPRCRLCACVCVCVRLLQPTHHACTDSWAALLHSAEGEPQVWVVLGANAVHTDTDSNGTCACCAVCRTRAQ